MSILDQQEDLESFSDEMLVGETQQPTGQYPLFLVATEIERRAMLRKKFQQAQEKGEAVAPSILEQRVAEMGPPQPQQGQIPPPMGGGIPTAGPPVEQLNPQQEQQMQGGLMAFQGGGVVEGGFMNQVRFPWQEGYGRDLEQATGVAGGRLWDAYRDDPTYAMPNWLRDPIRSASGFPEEDPETAWGDRLVDAFDIAPRESEQIRPNPTSALNRQLLAWGDAVRNGAVDSETGEVRQRVGGGGLSVMDQIANMLGEGNVEAITGGLRRGMDNIDDYEDEADAARLRLTGLSDAEIENLKALQEQMGKKSAAEIAMEQQQRSPEDLARSRRMRGLGLLGGVIGGATGFGDIPKGLAGISETLHGMGEEQLSASNALSLEIAKSQDSRELASLGLGSQIAQRRTAAAAADLEALANQMEIASQGRAQIGTSASNYIMQLRQMVASAASGGLTEDMLSEYNKTLGHLTSFLGSEEATDNIPYPLLERARESLGIIMTLVTPGLELPGMSALEREFAGGN